MRVLWLLFILSLVGCDRFRYFCQDPDNWDKPRCQRPRCAVTGTCPDQLLKPEVMKEEANEPPKVNQPIPCNDAGAARCGN
jgi:hypothetical protein